MDFDAILEQILDLVQSQRRVSYRALKRRFNVDDDYLEDLKEEILFAHRHICDEDRRGLIWTDPDAEPTTAPAAEEKKDSAPSSIEHASTRSTVLASLSVGEA